MLESGLKEALILGVIQRPSSGPQGHCPVRKETVCRSLPANSQSTFVHPRGCKASGLNCSSPMILTAGLHSNRISGFPYRISR